MKKSNLSILNCQLSIALLLLPLFLCSCQKSNKATVPVDPNGSQVILIDTDTFPQEMVGVWENEEQGWILRFEEDGRLSKIRHTLGRSDLKAGETAKFPLYAGGLAMIEPGPWITQYSAKTRELVVEINLNKFIYDVNGDVVHGSCKHFFTGTIPIKGETTFRVNWITFPNYIATTADKTYEDYKLPFEAGQEDQGEIVFKKVEIKMDDKKN